MMSKKNILRTRFGKIAICKSNSFSEPTLGSRTSPYLQEKLVLLGVNHVFEQVPQIVQSILGIEVNTSQAYRVLQAVSDNIEDPHLPSESLKEIQSDPNEQVYAMVDGAFFFTDKGWDEVKLARVFKADPIFDKLKLGAHLYPSEWDMGRSEYVAHRGSHIAFKEKFEKLLDSKSGCQKVFITDGATWITNWISESYPTSCQILDFYHVCEKLGLMATFLSNGASWLAEHKAYLLEGKVDLVCEAIKNLKDIEGQEKVVSYFEKNAFRMKYDEYRKKGLMISSAPIESAHRTVLQVRMKRSGQRWSDRGCDAMIKLRVAYKSEKFSLVRDVLRKQVA